MTQPGESPALRCAPAWRAPLVVLGLGLVAWWALPDQLGLLTRVAIAALFVLSLDLLFLIGAVELRDGLLVRGKS